MMVVGKKRDLKMAPANEMVLVRSNNKIYWCEKGEWIEKVYFSVQEIAGITGEKDRYVCALIRKLNLRPKNLRSKNLAYRDVKKVIAVVKLRRDGVRYFETIKAKLNL